MMPEEPQNINPQSNPSNPQPSSTPQWFSSGPITPPTASFDPIPAPVSNSGQSPAPTPTPSPATFSAPKIEPYVEPFESTNPNQPVQQPIEPTIQSSQFQPAPTPIQPIISSQISNIKTTSKKGRFGLILGVIIAAALVIMGGGTVLAYNLWYENPQKIVADSIVNIITAKSSIYTGNITIDSSSYKVTLNITAKQINTSGSFDANLSLNVSGADYSVAGSALVDTSGNVYFKASKLDSVAGIAKIELSSIDPDGSIIDGLVAKINDKWIKISSDDLKQFSDTYATAKTCVNDTVTKFRDDKSAVAEITNLYQKNPFIIIDKNLGQKDGSYEFQIKGNTTAANKFVNGLKDTKIYKSLKSCDSTFSLDGIGDIADTDNSSSNNGTIDLWVDGWTHQITKASLNSKSDDGSELTGTIVPKYNQTFVITAPSTYISLSDLKSYIDETIQSISSSSNSSSVVDTDLIN
jgi:hypothetical protein